MRFILAAFLAFGVMAPQDAIAGAWLREEGKGFASVSATLDAEKQAMTTTYLEYGWTSRTTLGAKLETESTGMRGTGLVFMVKPVGDTNRPARLSWNIGIGAAWSEVSISPLLRAGLSWGRGISFVNRDGWLTFDASVEWDALSAQTTTRLDSTMGFALTEQSKAMLQVFFTQSPDGGSAKIAPSWLYRPQGRNFTYQFGAELPASRSEEPKLKIGFWRDF